MDIAGLDEHHLQGRHLGQGRDPPERPLLGHPARLQRRRHRRRPGPDDPPVERVADRLGLRHHPAAAGRRRGQGHRDRPEPRSACPTSRSRSPAPACGATTRCTRPTCRSSGSSRPATRPPAPAVERARLQHLRPGLLQPRLEARGGAAGTRPGPELLETYSAERAPVARQIVTRANKSSREFGQFFEVLGLTEAETEEEMREQIEERKANTPRGAAKRAALVEAMELKNYEFNAHGVELGQFYESTAIVGDGIGQARARPRPRAVLPGLHRARRAPAARLGRRRRAQGLHPRPRPVRHVHADHRHRRRGRGRRPPRRSATTSASRSRR